MSDFRNGRGTGSLKMFQAARLRLPPSLSRVTIALIVEQTIDELGLRDAADTVVGGPLRKGISGGEKRSVFTQVSKEASLMRYYRRLSIGCVLVTLPSVLILDVRPFPPIKPIHYSSSYFHRSRPPG